MTQSLNNESRKHFEEIAGEALAQLESIAETARDKLYVGRTLGSDALANINTMTSSLAIQRLDKISQANRKSYQVLVTEPAIARVVVSDEEFGSLAVERAEVGASPLVQASARRFVNPVKRYLDGIPKRYRAFRREHLAEHNIQVIACRKGQAVGLESNVRVFDIQHIKGLGFEAVFFVSIDQLATLHPALFDKYLYVGTTRAATHLGVICQGSLPSAIESLRPHFCHDWQQGD